MYTEKLTEHFTNPRNVGILEDADGSAMIGDPDCGDYLCMYIKVKDMHITEIAFKCKGCPASIASASATTEMAKGKHIHDAILIKPSDVAEYLGGMPEQKLHCSNLGVAALWHAMADYLGLLKGDDSEFLSRWKTVQTDEDPSDSQTKEAE